MTGDHIDRQMELTIEPWRLDQLMPYPIAWDDRERQTLFAGYVLATAKSMNIVLRWGGD